MPKPITEESVAADLGHLLVNRLAQTPTEHRANHAATAHQEGFRLAFRDVAVWLTTD